MLLLLSIGIPQDKPDETRPPKKGDTVAIRGCLSGGVIEAGEITAPAGKLESLLSYDYRLTGDKKLVKALKDEHTNHVDVVTGVLKTDLPQERRGLETRVGNTRIGFGTPSPGGPPPRALPVLEVKSFEHSDVRCR